MTGYGLYALGAGLVDLFGPSQLTWMANLIAIALGAMLVVAGVFVRVGLPGSLALALTALFGLQSLSLHSAAPLYGQVAPEPQIALALFGALLVGLAHSVRLRPVPQTSVRLETVQTSAPPRRGVRRTPGRRGPSGQAQTRSCAGNGGLEPVVKGLRSLGAAAGGAAVDALVATAIANHDGAAG